MMIDQSMNSSTKGKCVEPMNFIGVAYRNTEEEFLTGHCTVCRQLTRLISVLSWWLSWSDSLPGTWDDVCFFQVAEPV